MPLRAGQGRFLAHQLARSPAKNATRLIVKRARPASIRVREERNDDARRHRFHSGRRPLLHQESRLAGYSNYITRNPGNRYHPPRSADGAFPDASIRFAIQTADPLFCDPPRSATVDPFPALRPMQSIHAPLFMVYFSSNNYRLYFVNGLQEGLAAQATLPACLSGTGSRRPLTAPDLYQSDGAEKRPHICAILSGSPATPPFPAKAHHGSHRELAVRVVFAVYIFNICFVVIL